MERPLFSTVRPRVQQRTHTSSGEHTSGHEAPLRSAWHAMAKRAQFPGSAQEAQQQQRKPPRKSSAAAAVTTVSSELSASASPVDAPRKHKRKKFEVLSNAVPLRPIRPRTILPAPAAELDSSELLSTIPPVAPEPALGADAVWLPMPMAMSLLSSAYPVLSFDDTVVLSSPPPPVDPATLTGLAVSTLSSLSVAAFVAESGKTSPMTREKRKHLNAAKRRDQCRTNQARYRTKLRDQELELEDQVAALKQQVQALEQRAEQLRTKSSTSNSSSRIEPISEGPSDAVLIALEERRSPMEIVTEYFRQFKYGLGLESDRYMLRDELPQYPLHLRRQIAFLYAVVHPDLRLGGLVGVDALVDQWRKYSRYFDDLQLDLIKAMVVEDEDAPRLSQDQHDQLHCQKEIIQATATLTVIFSDETIRGVFPHLERNERLKETLMDKRVSLDFVHTFGFSGVNDGEAPKVQYLNCFVDFVKAMLTLFDDVNDVATVLQQARIVSGFYLCD